MPFHFLGLISNQSGVKSGATTLEALSSESCPRRGEIDQLQSQKKAFTKHTSSKKRNWGAGWRWFNLLEKKLCSCLG